MTWLRVRTVAGRFGKVAVAAATIGVAGFAHSAAADPPTTAGWWTAANPGINALVRPPVSIGTGPEGTPSDVPAGGLEVTTTAPTGIVSYAAINYTVRQVSVQSLVLEVAATAANVPGSQVEVCALMGTGTFAPASGAPLAAGPAFDCAHSELGVTDAAGKSITFPVAGFVHEGRLAVAIVAVGNSRLVFAAPGQQSVRTTPAPTITPLPELSLSPDFLANPFVPTVDSSLDDSAVAAIAPPKATATYSASRPGDTAGGFTSASANTLPAMRAGFGVLVALVLAALTLRRNGRLADRPSQTRAGASA